MIKIIEIKIIMKKGKIINDQIYFIFIFLFYYFLVDFAITRGLRTSNIVQAFQSDEKYGYTFKPNHKIKLVGPFDDSIHYSFTDSNKLRKSQFKELCPLKYKNIENNRYTVYTGILVGDKKLSAFNIEDDKNFVSLINSNCDNSLLFLNGGVDTYDIDMSLNNIKRIRDQDLVISDLNILTLSVDDFFGNKYLIQKEVKNYLKRVKRKNNFFYNTFNQIYTSFALSSNLISNLKSSFHNFNNINFSNYLNKNYAINKVCRKIIDKVEYFANDTDNVNKIYLMVYPEFNNDRTKLLDTKSLESCLSNSSREDNLIDLIEIHQNFENELNNLKRGKFKQIDFNLEHIILKKIISNEFISYTSKYDLNINQDKSLTLRQKLINKNISIFGKERIEELLKNQKIYNKLN
tara:strand:+ start:705 stop:1919 length:1215 start_codon:yes stop_codon:yes gene_type:complete